MHPRFREHLIKLERKRVGIHPDPKVSLLLDRNERVIPYHSSIMDKLQKQLLNVPLNLYPDLELFYRKLSKWLDVDEGQIYITEGVSGAIKSLIETIATPKDTIVFPTPTFALYPVYCRMFDVKFRTVMYTRDFNLDMDDMLRAVDETTAMVFLPNPNVPIEGTLDLKKLKRLARHCSEEGAFLVVDEVYYPFGGPTAMELIDEFDNLFVMRSFSKAFGLAGIRVGYLAGRAENIDYVSKTRTGYETNSVSAAIASFFMDNDKLIQRYVGDVKEGLAFLKKEFTRLGLLYNGGDASNFIYVDMGDESVACNMVSRLKARNIYIRGGWPVPFSTGLCITGGPEKIMKEFMKEFSSILGDIENGR